MEVEMDTDDMGEFYEDPLGFDIADPTQPAEKSPSSLTASNSGTSASESEVRALSRRRPIPKKGHTKSRRGCQNCKRRKVKCQETLPECANCRRLGLNCVYPGPSSSSSTPPPTAALQSTPSAFTMEDLHFFHHFLVTAYPPLPMDGDGVWKGVAALSHHYDYLAHAMLGLAASHLYLYTGNYAEQGLAHRVKAIQALNKSLSKPCASTAEGDARYGAIMALTFQASCMPEGMTEFLAMTRGCQILAQTGMPDFSKSLFREFTAEGYSGSVKRIVGALEMIPTPSQKALLADFLVSLRRLAPLLSSPLEIRFLAATERVSKMVSVSAVDAFSEFARMYILFTGATNEEFSQFSEPKNYPGQILLLHFTMIEFAIGELTLGAVNMGARFGFRRRASIAWLDSLLKEVPDRYQCHLEWPLKYAAHLITGLSSSYVIPNAHPRVLRLLESLSPRGRG